MTMTVECGRCGHVFETAARTNTRCRRCHHVVAIGRSTSSAVRSRLRVDASSAEPASRDDDLGSAGLAGVVLAAGAFALWHGTTLRRPMQSIQRALVAAGPTGARPAWCS